MPKETDCEHDCVIETPGKNDARCMACGEPMFIAEASNGGIIVETIAHVETSIGLEGDAA